MNLFKLNIIWKVSKIYNLVVLWLNYLLLYSIFSPGAQLFTVHQLKSPQVIVY